VLVWHYVHAQLQGVTPGTPLAFLKQAISFTWSGVDLFFVLSGFLIAGILLDHREAGNYFRVFYIRRVCRIFPLYYAHLALFVMLLVLGMDQAPGLYSLFDTAGLPLWSYATFTQNIVMATRVVMGSDWLAVTWSLAIEEQFYLVLPFIIRFSPPRALPWILGSLLLMAPMLRAMVPSAWAVIGMPWRADSLMAGALLAWFVRKPGFMETVIAGRRWLYVVFWFLLSGAVATVFVTARFPFNLTFTYLWLACLYATLLLVVLVDRDGWIARLFRPRALVWLGTVSYGVYLFHQAVSALLHGLIRYLPPTIMEMEGLAVTCLALVVTLALAGLSFRYFERTIINFGHHYRYS
jgi:peptidoglycan/LPS O-acetylase OafA/YrhL